MIHKGEIVEKAVRVSGIKLTELAKKMKLSRRHLYNLFEEPNLSVEYIYKIGKIIHYDFTNEIGSYLKNSDSDIIENTSDAPIPYGNETEYWKNKYFGLLEKYNELQMKMIVLLEKQ